MRKHDAEVLCFANPVQYEYRIRKIRVSKPENEVKAYLKSVYKVEGVSILYVKTKNILHNQMLL